MKFYSDNLQSYYSNNQHRAFITVLFLVLNICGLSQTEWDWIIQGDGHPVNYGQSNEINDVIQTQDGHIYISGSFRDTLIFEADTLISYGFDDAFIAKYDTLQNLHWVKQLAGIGVTDCKSLVEDDEGNVVAGGYFQNEIQFDTLNYSYPNFSNLFMFWIDPQGNLIQDVITTNSSYAEVFDMVLNSDNDLIISGNFFGTLLKDDVVLNSIEGQNYFVIKVNPNGFFEWGIQSFGGGNIVDGIDLDSEDSIYLSAAYEDGAIIGDTTLSTASFNHSLGVVKYLTDSSYEWIYIVTGNDEIHGKGICINTNDEVGCLGEFRGEAIFGEGDTTFITGPSYDGAFFILNPNGQHQKSIAFGGINNDIPEDIVHDQFGNFIITGKFGALAQFGDSILDVVGTENTFLMKINQDSIVSINSLPGIGSNEGITLFYGQNETVYLGGIIRNTIFFNDQDEVSTSGKDFYLISVSDYIDSTWSGFNEYLFIDNPSLQVFPNPCKDYVYFELPSNVVSIDIYSSDYSGIHYSLKSMDTPIFKWTHNLSSGLYIIKMRTESQVSYSKLLVSK